MSSRSSSPASPRPTPDLADAHILVVDDRPNDLRLLTEILRAARCRISVAFDGLQAYHRAQ
ncbi:DNA-binding response regulator, partial [Geobacillus sp. LEMMJ02]